MTSRQIRRPQLTRVVVDPRNAKADRFIPLREAMRLYNQGLLYFDETNGHYCTTRPGNPFIPTGWAEVEGGALTPEAWESIQTELEAALSHIPSPSYQDLLDDHIPY